MIKLDRIPDKYDIEVQGGAVTDAKVEFEVLPDRVRVWLTASADRPRFIKMRWSEKQTGRVYVYNDSWERLEGNNAFGSLNADRALPWYFIMTDGRHTDCAGVAVRPNSFVTFTCDGEGVTGFFDVRCGGTGVKLDGRRLHVADILCRGYDGMSSFNAAKDFCRVMCTDPLLPDEPVYGGNNWYYAYGEFTPDEFIGDARLQAELAGDAAVRPFMVMDDGWEINRCCGPWLPKEEFKDMKGIADKVKALGVRPGLWVRFLHNQKVYDEHPEYRINRCGESAGLDPSRPEVLEIIKEDIERVKSWGYELIKHDFSSFDIFGRFDFNMSCSVFDEREWSFFDETKTSAEIVIDFYKAIHDACGDVLIIGCNTFSHLIAGLAQLNRVGDDTSGSNADRTRALGVNSLAFRLPQHGAFYAIDADCVGFIKGTIPWEFNKQFLDILAKSGTPLFISCAEHTLNESEKAFVKDAYARFLRQSDTIEPLDWEYNAHPRIWSVNGTVEEYDWQTEIPRFCYCRRWQNHT